MRKVLVIAVREYDAAVRTKAFVVSLLLMPLMMVGSIGVQHLLKDFHDTQPKRFAVVDRTPGARLFPRLAAAVERYNASTFNPVTGRRVLPPFVLAQVPAPPDTPAAVGRLRGQLSGEVRQGEWFGFVEIGPAVFDPAPAGGRADERHIVRYQTSRPTHRDFPALAERAVDEAVREARVGREVLTPALPCLAAATAGVLAAPAGPCLAAASLYPGRALTPGRLDALLRPVPLTAKGLSMFDPVTGTATDEPEQGRLAPVIVPGALMLLMFMVVILGTTPLMQGVLEEKMQRIAEVLLGSVEPFPLMTGKLLGMAGVSLTISAVYLAGTWWSAHRYGFADYVGTDVLAWFLLFQALAALMYGSLFIAIGAACTDAKEAQNFVWPVMLLATLPMFVLGNVLQEPNSGIVTALSFFPFATPTLMVARMAVPPGIPAWQPAVGALAVLLTTLACVWAAGRIFRVGILLQGKSASVSDLARWVLRG